jgi:hypothetical protein
MRELCYWKDPSFARERKSWKDKRCPLNDHCNIKGGLTITKARAQNNGEIFENIKKGTNRPKGLVSYIVGKKKKKKKKRERSAL